MIPSVLSPLLLLLGAAHARAPVARAVIVDSPLPSADSSGSAAAGTCPVVWSVPEEGQVDLTVGSDCPTELAPVVAEAAGRWLFGAVRPSPGSTHLVVKRWFHLQAADGQAPTWSAEINDPRLSSSVPEDCVQSKRRVAPDFPPSIQAPADPVLDTCFVRIGFDVGTVGQVEVWGCPNAAGLASADAAERWTFRYCEEADPSQLSVQRSFKFVKE